MEIGGAERQVVALARGLRRGGHEVAVAVFYTGGAFEEELRAAGVPIHDLEKRGRWDLLGFMLRLGALVRKERPDVLHSYLGGPNVFAALLKPLFPSLKVVWGIRSAMSDLSAYDRVTRMSPRLEVLASAGADAIIANSDAARRQAAAAGMEERKIEVISNGIDTTLFSPDLDGRARLRGEWGVPEGAPLIGMVARLDPVKNHSLFLKAAALAAGACPSARFVCVGDGAPEYRRALERLGLELGLAERLIWAGRRKATSAVYSALEVAVLSSDSESFPNVVAEAMACGTPVVVTDTGDASVIVGDTGAVVPRQDPAALSAGILGLLGRGREQASARARSRIEQAYSEELLVERTERVLQRVLQGELSPC
ncbi:MAG TPA: glycosyltransferase [Anaeromyxobacteraceae bacterium]|nr:glycosyltransferase [Anaeromyxobacteraceae bacterium]